jgi:hypothetical protein
MNQQVIIKSLKDKILKGLVSKNEAKELLTNCSKEVVKSYKSKNFAEQAKKNLKKNFMLVSIEDTKEYLLVKENLFD